MQLSAVCWKKEIKEKDFLNAWKEKKICAIIKFRYFLMEMTETAKFTFLCLPAAR